MGPDEARRHRKTEFGPSSEYIEAKTFAENASAILTGLTAMVHDFGASVEDENIGKELNLDILREESSHVLEDKTLREVLDRKYREYASKLKEHDLESSSLSADPEVAQLQALINQSPLRHWPPPKQSIYYFRKNKKVDENGLTDVRPAQSSTIPSQASQSEKITQTHESSAIITVSYYSRLLKSSNRNATHAAGLMLDAVYCFLSTQSLQDIYNYVPCSVKNLPKRNWEKHPSRGNVTFVREKSDASTEDQQRALASQIQEEAGMIIEDTVYSVGDERWARQLVEFIQNNPDKGDSKIVNIGPPLQGISLGDIQLKVQMPYWIVHQGNCQHCWVVEDIRLLHPCDPQNAATYPLAIHLGRQSHPTCHHCGRNPATLAVNGDPRLGESPSRICELCWQLIGKEAGTTGVIVVPFHSVM